MQVKKGQTAYIHGRKFKAGQKIPKNLEAALVSPKKEVVKDESSGASGKRPSSKSGG